VRILEQSHRLTGSESPEIVKHFAYGKCKAKRVKLKMGTFNKYTHT